MTTLAKKELDLMLVVGGMIVGFATPVAIISRIEDSDVSGLEVLDLLSQQPFHSVPSVLFAIAGFTLVSVGLNGLRGKYADAAERFDGIYTTAASTAVVSMGALSVLLALSKVVAFVEYRDVRVLATIVGALIGLHLSGYVEGNENTPAAFAFAGGLMGYMAAPALLLLLGVAGLLLFGGPLIALLLSFLGGSTELTPSSAALPAGNQKQIQDLQGRIAFVRQSGVAPHLVQEEVDKLNKQITALGGTS